MPFDVLIVDDSAAMRRVIRRVIEISGFETGEFFDASNGADALQMLDLHAIDVVLTDINMPVMDGEAFVREVGRRERLAGVPIIVISTDATEARRSRLDELGAQGYVTKPFSPERLRAELEAVLGVPSPEPVGERKEAIFDELSF